MGRGFESVNRMFGVALDASRAAGYTHGMKTAISLADDLYLAADRFAARKNKTRSQLYAEALAEYLARHDEDAVTETLDAVYGDGHESDPALEAAGRRRLLAEPW